MSQAMAPPRAAARTAAAVAAIRLAIAKGYINRRDPVVARQRALSARREGLEVAQRAALRGRRPLARAHHRRLFARNLPWFSEATRSCGGRPIRAWCSFPDELRVSRSLRKAVSARPYETRVDTAFREVIAECAAPREGQAARGSSRDGAAYTALHERGFAHIGESWQDGELVGGLYGISLGEVSSASRCSRVRPTRRRWRWCGWWSACARRAAASSTASRPPPTWPRSAPGRSRRGDSREWYRVDTISPPGAMDVTWRS
jgi:hypothetical protein